MNKSQYLCSFETSPWAHQAADPYGNLLVESTQLFCVNVSSSVLFPALYVCTETHFRWVGVFFSVEICAKCGYTDTVWPKSRSGGRQGEKNMTEAKRAESGLGCAQEQPLHVEWVPGRRQRGEEERAL